MSAEHRAESCVRVRGSHRLATALAMLLAWVGMSALAQQAPVKQPKPMRYQVFASDLRVDRKVIGEVTNSIRGVPAEPVDSIAYDGEGSIPRVGSLMMEVDVASDTGLVVARWTDDHGDWEYRQTRFMHPEHLSGIRIGSSKDESMDLVNEGVAQNVYLHGDTTAGTPVLPTVFAYLGAWGPADVTLNGEPFENPFELPAPQWLGHLMVIEGVRNDEDGTVRAISGEIYNPMRHKKDGAVDPDDLELHLTFHDERFPKSRNRPAMFQFQYHMTFEDVEMRIIQANRPVPKDFPEPLKPDTASAEGKRSKPN